MLLNIFIAALMMVITTAIHAGVMVLLLHGAQRYRQKRTGLLEWLHQSHVYAIACVILVLFLVALLEALVWALPLIEIR